MEAKHNGAWSRAYAGYLRALSEVKGDNCPIPGDDTPAHEAMADILFAAEIAAMSVLIEAPCSLPWELKEKVEVLQMVANDHRHNGPLGDRRLYRLIDAIVHDAAVVSDNPDK